MKNLLFTISLFCIICFGFIFSSNAFATSVEPLCSYTFNSSNTINANIQYCDNFLSSITYVEIDFGVDSDTHSMTLTYNTKQYNNQSGRHYYLLGVSTQLYSYISTASGYNDTYPITVSFYNTQPGPQPEPPEPCPEPEPCEDCGQSPIVTLFKSGFWGVATALVSLIVPILALFLIFRLVHDLLWGKG